MLKKGVAYSFDIAEEILDFRSASFRAEKGSVLHSGVYNRETASVLAAGTCLIVLGFFFALGPRVAAIYYFAAALPVLVLLFLFFRTFVFPEEILQVVIDKKNNVVTLMRKRFRHTKKVLLPLEGLTGIREDYKKIAPDNPDGIKVIEKISRQHGTVIPGFGETDEFYTVEFEFADKRRIMVFSSRDYSGAADVAGTLKKFIER